ncbi:MAG: TatD family hydrolase [Acidobacteriota bacterium]|nr:TatD family hydrolase [Acidobacteriota bacterium]MDQ7086580.1 TatD family hydrolase [Acidobacteriota bacterium]
MTIMMPALIDAHAHLADPVFDADREAVLERAARAGVERVVTVGETLSDARRILELSREHAALAPAAGLYPTHLDLEQAEAVEAFIREHRDELVAVGEIGLDRWVVQDEEGRHLQREIFRRQVALAMELELAINVHSRSAGRHVIALLEEMGARRVLLHAFDGKAGTAEIGARAGFFFSIPPSILRSRQKVKLVERLPLERLLLETDSPVLGVQPGERNEPARITAALTAVAGIKGVDVRQVAEVTTANARRLFGLG